MYSNRTIDINWYFLLLDPDQRVEVEDPQRKKRDQDLSRMKKGQGQDLWKKKKDHDQDQWMIMRGQDHAQVLNDQDHLPRKTTGKMDQGLDPGDLFIFYKGVGGKILDRGS